MKPFLSLAFAGLTLAAAAPAGAADLLGSAPLSIPASQGATAVEIGSNWYVRGEIGIAFDRMPTVTLSSFAALPAITPSTLTFGGRSSSNTDFVGGLGFGYRFNDYLRFDGTWDYRAGPSRTRSGFVVCPYGLTGVTSPTTGLPAGYLYNPADTCDGFMNFHQNNHTFLANAYVDLGTYAGFTPYVGGGAGLNVNTMGGNLNFFETANGQPYAAGLTSNGAFPSIWVNPSGQTLAPQPAIAFAAQNWNRSFSSTTYRVAWALAAGVGFQLNPSATLDVGYRYVNAGTSSMHLNPQTGLSVRQNNSSQQVLVGIRYMLQ